jgi:hypothetical protein
MSLIRCHFHEFTFDSYVHEICPLCEVRDEIETRGLPTRAISGPREVGEGGSPDRLGLGGSACDVPHR